MSGTRRKPGQLGPYVDGYRSKLLSLGYTPETVRCQLKVLGQLGRWMSVNAMTPAELSPSGVEEFLAYRRADAYRQTPCRRGLALLLEHLIDEHVIVDSDPPARTALDELVDGYRGWLVGERGLATTTVLRYEATARRYLQQRAGDGDRAGVAGLTGAEANAFLLAESARCSVGAAKAVSPCKYKYRNSARSSATRPFPTNRTSPPGRTGKGQAARTGRVNRCAGCRANGSPTSKTSTGG
jgi:hypothetical protein